VSAAACLATRSAWMSSCDAQAKRPTQRGSKTVKIRDFLTMALLLAQNDGAVMIGLEGTEHAAP